MEIIIYCIIYCSAHSFYSCHICTIQSDKDRFTAFNNQNSGNRFMYLIMFLYGSGNYWCPNTTFLNFPPSSFKTTLCGVLMTWADRLTVPLCLRVLVGVPPESSGRRSCWQHCRADAVTQSPTLNLAKSSAAAATCPTSTSSASSCCALTWWARPRED